MAAICFRPILVGLAFGAIITNAGSIQSAKADDSLCGDRSSGNFWEGKVKPAECSLLQEFPDLARREGKRLTIKLADGKSKLFEDRGECWVTECTNYFLGRLNRKSDVVVIWKPPLEGSGAVLLDRRSGEEFEVDDFPEASPDERYWTIVDGAAAFSSGTTQVLIHENGHFQVIGEMERDLCLFKSWDQPPAFRLLCYDRSVEATKEYRAVPDGKGGLALSETRRALSVEEGDFPF